VTINVIGTLPWKGALFIFHRKYYTKSTVKHSAAYKLNQQINGKEAEGKKRKDSRITFEMAYSAC